MNIRDLEYFVKLTEVKHFSKVATSFNVSQPTITFAVKRLEKEMNCQLLFRHHTSALEVTDEGKQFLNHARAILNHYQLAKREINEMGKDQIMIGLPPLIENNYFPVIAKHLKDHQLLNHIETTEEGSQTTLSMLQDGKVDLAILGLVDPLDQSEIRSEKFDQQPFQIYVSKDSPLATKKDGVYFSELKDYDFIQFKKGFVHNYAFEILARQNGINPNVIFQSDEMTTIVSMIADNIGIGFFTPLLPVADKRVVAIPLLDSDAPTFNVTLVYRQSHYFNEWQRKVLNCINEGINDFKN